MLVNSIAILGANDLHHSHVVGTAHIVCAAGSIMVATNTHTHPFNFPLVIATNVIMTSIKGHSTSAPVPRIVSDIYWAGSLLTEIIMILFTQSTAV